MTTDNDINRPELRYYAYIANDIILSLKGISKKISSILDLRPEFVKQSNQIELEYDNTFLKIVYRRWIERKDWTEKLEVFHIELIPISQVSKIDVDVRQHV